MNINRRHFMGLAGLGTAGVLVAQQPPLPRTLPSEHGPAPGAAPPPFELDEITVNELQEGLSSGRFMSRKLTEAYLARIDAIDKRGPAINAVIEINPDALAIAEVMDRERRNAAPGPLHGIPVLIKDNIDTGDRMHTSAGSLALADSIAARDSAVAKKLRDAGAVIIGKTNLSEWANFRSTHSTSGWSGRGGQTKNPYVLDRNPCGSSSGTGAGIAANLAAVGVGTETDGSVVCPSSASALVGIKPTLGLIGGAGIVPIAHSQDTAGPMCRTVADAAILLGALAEKKVDYGKSLDPNGLRGARIGVARKFFGINDSSDAVMKEAIAAIKHLGATIVDPADMATSGKYDDSEMEVLLYEFKTDLNKYLAGLGLNVKTRTLADLIKFNQENRDREMPYFGQELFERAQKKGPLTAEAYKKALAKNHKMSRAEGIDATLKKHKLDALIAPTGGPVWPIDLINGDHYTGGYSTASAVAGYPHITVPAGQAFGLPVGLSFFAGAWSEAKLIKFAYAFEQETKARRKPGFVPMIRLGGVA
ncbi:MAG TPA: amidase [Thermoanaerobaculia bacterium]|nr:amidase [Thermoanaerobaculia bacterium]